ncbi:MAG: hypothetical protein LRZ92_06450 [Methanosarcinaceae archaeon]|jgi:hypothetical protein|nr:hypothetical protein [Methanosarcinaceae archaeon]NKQ39069.1 hypothetical protein [Methanosarcinales archaeon]
MLFPSKYKCIGLTKSLPAIDDDKNNTIYFLTEYLIAGTDDNPSIYFVNKNIDNESLLQSVESLDLIAKGNEIVWHDKELNIKNRTLLIDEALEICANKKDVTTVIFTGIDKHITFVHKPDLSESLEIEIIDIVPPKPAWLIYVIEKLESVNLFGDFGIRFSKNIIDLSKFEGTQSVFPCSASGLKGKYLDSDTITEKGSLLIGCEISKKLFETKFEGLGFDFINICPFKSDLFKPTKPFITRCCLTENSGLTKLKGIDGVVVHWGASEFDIAEAIKKLALHLRSKNKNNNINYETCSS